jgi:hypothetical protein
MSDADGFSSESFESDVRNAIGCLDSVELPILADFLVLTSSNLSHEETLKKVEKLRMVNVSTLSLGEYEISACCSTSLWAQESRFVLVRSNPEHILQ